jgi:hypothetical protein
MLPHVRNNCWGKCSCLLNNNNMLSCTSSHPIDWKEKEGPWKKVKEVLEWEKVCVCVHAVEWGSIHKKARKWVKEESVGARWKAERVCDRILFFRCILWGQFYATDCIEKKFWQGELSFRFWRRKLEGKREKKRSLIVKSQDKSSHQFLSLKKLIGLRKIWLWIPYFASYFVSIIENVFIFLYGEEIVIESIQSNP